MTDISFIRAGNIGRHSRQYGANTLIHPNSPGNAKLQGLTTQLDLGGNRYSAALVSLYPQQFITTEPTDKNSRFSSWYVCELVSQSRVLICYVSLTVSWNAPQGAITSLFYMSER